MSRRYFLKNTLLPGIAMLIAPSLLKSQPPTHSSHWFMPEEGEPHTRTWMAFIADDEIWTKKQIPQVQKDLALIARTIAQYEPVSILVRTQDIGIAKKLIGNTSKYPIEFIETELNDLWARDTAPTFVINENGEKAAVDFNFNGWGEKQAFEHDAAVAKSIAKQAKVQHIRSNLSLEGGCFEVDGQGTAIMTESCIINDNRNPGISKADIENELKDLLGLEKIIWLKGIKGQDITDGHTDFYARFAHPGVVVVSRDTDTQSYDYEITRDNINVLKNATDANGQPLELIILDTPWDIETRYGVQDFAAGYVGYYLCNNALIMQKFGDKQADNTAKKKLAKLFPDRTIEQIAINGIASGGGSIHCATQQEPET